MKLLPREGRPVTVGRRYRGRVRATGTRVGDGVGDRVGGGVGGGADGGGVDGGGVDGGGVDGGKVGVAAGAGPGAADTADFAALGQASTMVSETAADAMITIAPSLRRRTFISPDCSLGSARRKPFSEQVRSPLRNRYQGDA